jgi:DNA-binding NtrC family response regulator
MKAKSKKPQSGISEMRASANSRILVMDDDYIVRRLLDRILHESGYDVALSANGSEAFALYTMAEKEGVPFDAVIIDLIVREEVGGEELIGKLREINPHVKAIVSSGYVNESAMPGLKACGFSAMVAKPFTIEKMLNTLQDILLETNRFHPQMS